MATQYNSAAVIAGRALHPPWNEGTRVIARNLVRGTSTVRRVQVVSLTQADFRNASTEEPAVRHVYSGVGYGMRGDYLGMRGILRQVDQVRRTMPVGVVHLLNLPLALAPWLRRRGIRVIAHITLAQQAYLSPAERWRAVLGWRLFDPWVASYALSSPALTAPLRARGLPAAKLRVIPASIDTDLYQPAAPATIRPQLGVHPTERLVVYIGTLSPLRFPAPLIREALAQTAVGNAAPIRFLAFAPHATHSYNQTWSAAVDQQLKDIAGVSTQVVLGDLTDSEKAAWFQAADAVLVPFTAPVAVEPPLTLLEAMACGTAVVVTPHGNQSELVENGQNGMLYETPAELSAHLRDVFSSGPAAMAGLRAAARATIVQRHSLAAATAAATQVWAAVESPERL
jgi:glycosyltransferase involved in cell wall biosynthesis